MKKSAFKWSALFIALFPLLLQSAFAAVTCTGTAGLTPCEWAQEANFDEFLLAIGALLLVIVPVTVVLMGGGKVLQVLGWRKTSL
ncbi:hypothetical protein [Beggiatoa leptomitoformis]|uniref:Uncharacterized protein n=1 Tax=Beggiatoa leptomitoformis TaxID=288004 RepID=A0A2N9YCY1_9GAMM|nr:hypothetical protein [Beggiatoa leptomitoformis]ALG66427.1 hypothetical protein AL038_00070 [Beggiatoa leptomitoformis]AUI68296.1 hypothetical protein BLE401_06000 [Beggiatoa leptomitoformis]